MTGARPILGVDPGVTGGIAFLYLDGRIVADDLPTVDGSVDVDALVRRIREHAPRTLVAKGRRP
jgi:predicted RNase H-like nuclease (RuvC/YqgF family)